VEESKPAVENAAPAKSDLTPAAAPNPEVTQPENKMMLWLIGGLVAIILVVGGIYFYLSSQQKTQTQPTSTPAAKVEENLENDLNAVDVGDLDQEFSEVDKDLQGL